MKRVLLINPPQTYFKASESFNVYFPIGLMYLAAMVKDISQVEILDCLVSSDFAMRKDEETIHYGIPLEKIKEIIKEKQPDIVGISIPFTAQADNGMAVAAICKEVNPEITTIMGGPDPSVRYKDILQNNENCDYCVIGEGEETFYEFVKEFPNRSSLENVKGLAYKKDDTVHFQSRKFIMDLDKLPFPSFDHIDVQEYLQNKYLYFDRSIIPENSISVITSRGCPYDCVFCSIRLHMGKLYRYHSPEYVLKYLKLCIEKYGITNFHFEDDNLSLNQKRFSKMLDLFIENKLNIRWDTPNGIRADSLKEETLIKMKKSGCAGIFLAIESGNQRVLDEVIKKKTSLEYMIEIVRLCKKHDISACSFYVIGFPGETLEEMKDTVNLALKLYRKYNVQPALLVATPLYGTELYDTCIENGLIKKDLTPQELSQATQLSGNYLISHPELSAEKMMILKRKYNYQLNWMLVRKIYYYMKRPKMFIDKVKKAFVLLNNSRQF